MGLDLVLPRGAAARGGGDESLGDFVRRRLGSEALDKIAEPIVAGIHAGDPEVMSVRSTFPMFLEMENKYRSLMLGMVQRRRARARAAAAPAGAGPAPTARTRPAASATWPPGRASTRSSGGCGDLERRHRRDVTPADDRCTRRAASRAWQSARRGAHAGGWLRLSSGRPHAVADAVVPATPASERRAAAPVAPRRGDLSSIDYVSTATASVAFKSDQVGHDLKGFGFVVPRAEDRPVMATTWSSSKFDGRAPDGHVLLRSFLGRAGREAAAQLDDDEMAAVVLSELRDIMGITAEPEFVEIFRWPRGMPQYRVGHVELVAHIEAAVARVPGIELAGGAYHGIGIGDRLRELAAPNAPLEHVRGLPETHPATAADLPLPTASKTSAASRALRRPAACRKTPEQRGSGRGAVHPDGERAAGTRCQKEEALSAHEAGGRSNDRSRIGWSACGWSGDGRPQGPESRLLDHPASSSGDHPIVVALLPAKRRPSRRDIPDAKFLRGRAPGARRRPCIGDSPFRVGYSSTV
jgi:protoporphyrinogen oxidase